MIATHVVPGGYVVPFRPDLANLMPHAKALEHSSGRLLAVRAGVDEARLLRNTGHACPSPILTGYNWAGGTPWDVQRATAAELVMNPGMFVLSDLGTGKTRAVLYAFDWLRQMGLCRRLLVTCTVSTMTRVWEQEIFKHFPHLTRTILYGDRAKRLQALKAGADICIINHDGVGVITEDLVRSGFDVVCVDELAIFRNARTERWKAMNRVARASKYVWGLTGSPIPRAPTDAWAQIKLVAPAKTSKHFGPFRDAMMHRVTQFKWVPKRDAAQQVFATMQPAVRFTRDDVAELPEFQEIDRPCTMSDPQNAVYNQLIKAMRATYGTAELLAVNEGVLLGKLLQVAAGWVYTTDKGVVALPCEDKFQTLFDLIAETDRKIIVFAPFIHAVEGIYARLVQEQYNCAMIHGGTPKGARDKIFTEFQDGPNLQIIVAHPGTMAHGLTLTAANTIAWWSPVQSLEIYEQANGRINRPGQTAKMLAARLVGSSIERRVYQRLQQHAALQGVLLELFEEASVQNI